jgi:putative photosynthetic complex assembly protein
MSEIDSQPFPKGALIAAGLLVGLTVALTGAVSLGLVGKPADAADRRAESGMAARTALTLAFADRADGALIIRDVERDRIVTTIEPGEKSGFIRGVLRSFSRERRMLGVGQEPGFRLTLWANSSLSLTDQATGRTVELDAFGPDNRAAFAALLPPQEVAQR